MKNPVSRLCGLHGVVRWYLGPALEHYRCYQCYVKTTRSEQISDTVEFFPKDATMPTITPIEAAVMAVDALTAALHQKKPPIHLAELHNPSKSALERLAAIYTFPTDLVEQSMENPAPSPRVEATLVAGRTRLASTPKEPSKPVSLFANAVMHPITGDAMTYRQLITDLLTSPTWLRSAANEFGRLAQGVGRRIKGTDMLRFIWHTEVPADRTPTYPRFVCEERPQKEEVARTRLTLGGNLINYPGNVSTCTAELETIKILVNSTISTPGAIFITADVENFYLETP
jgi:hypothetical protein